MPLVRLHTLRHIPRGLHMRDVGCHKKGQLRTVLQDQICEGHLQKRPQVCPEHREEIDHGGSSRRSSLRRPWAGRWLHFQPCPPRDGNPTCSVKRHRDVSRDVHGLWVVSYLPNLKNSRHLIRVVDGRLVHPRDISWHEVARLFYEEMEPPVDHSLPACWHLGHLSIVDPYIWSDGLAREVR